jgi:photosystem II reaction center protein PsbP
MREAMRLLAAVVLVPFVLFAAPRAAAEDVIVLENGREIRGWIVDEKPELVKIDIGGGKMTYRRGEIREVRRDPNTPKDAAAKDAAGSAPQGPATPFEAAARREESSVLYSDGERRGTRVLRTTKLPEGWLFEEEIRRLDAAGAPQAEVRTTERADTGFRPISIQVRETDGVAEHRTVSAEVTAGLVRIVTARNGEKVRKDIVLPEEARFPFAARELYLRESKAFGGRIESPVFDPRTGAFARVLWRDAPPRPLRIEGRSLEARVVVRESAGIAEREWLDRDGTTVFAELDGSRTVAVACDAGAVERLRKGDADRVTGADSAGRTVYADKVRGWRVGKPDPTWTFEKPASGGPNALLIVRNEPLFATVDVLVDPDARPRTSLEEASDALERLCRTIAPDLRVLESGEIERDGLRAAWFMAAATTKGERTRTLARVVVKDGRVYRLLAACPEKAFETLRPDFEKILDSFRLD